MRHCLTRRARSASQYTIPRGRVRWAQVGAASSAPVARERPLQLHIPPSRFVAWFSDDCGQPDRNRDHELTNGVLIVAWFVASRRPGGFGRRRRSAACAWRAWAARRRLLGHAVNRFGQHERADDHDRRKGCRYDCRRRRASIKAVSTLKPDQIRSSWLRSVLH